MPNCRDLIERCSRIAVVVAHAIAVLVFAAPAFAQSAPSPFDEVMRLLAQTTRGTVDYSEIQYVSMLDRPLRSSGVLIYTAPAHLEKRTLLPKPASLIVDGSTLTVQRGKRTHVLDLHDYPQIAPFIDSIRATLAGDRGALESVFSDKFSGSVSDWSLSLEPKDANLVKYVKQIQIDGHGEQLTRVTIMQADGDHSVMTISPSTAQ